MFILHTYLGVAVLLAVALVKVARTILPEVLLLAPFAVYACVALSVPSRREDRREGRS